MVNGGRQEESNTTTTFVDNEKVVMPKAPVFLIFAEYLGYTTPLIEFAEKMCKGELKSLHMLRCLEVDAESVFKKMCSDYSKEDLRYWWDTFYDVAVQEYDEEFEKHFKTFKDDLPF